ncbi:MAG: hypothetical protein ACERK6_13265, partial [Candidatus Aminicenantaceae bacterium]
MMILATAPLVLAQAADEEIGWPREMDHPEAKVIIYQPQIDSFKGDILEARAAVSVTKKGSDVPVFGAAWFKARVRTDRDTRLVHFLDIEVPRVRFPEATPDQEKKLIAFLEKEIPKWELVASLD